MYRKIGSQAYILFKESGTRVNERNLCERGVRKEDRHSATHLSSQHSGTAIGWDGSDLVKICMYKRGFICFLSGMPVIQGLKPQCNRRKNVPSTDIPVLIPTVLSGDRP